MFYVLHRLALNQYRGLPSCAAMLKQT